MHTEKIYVATQPCSRLLEQIVAFSGKDLFVPASRESAMACQIFRAVQAQNLPEILKSLEDTSTDTQPESTPARDAVETAYDIVSTYFVDKPISDMECMDMVIVGAVAVSPATGHCVGRGYGSVDLSLAMLQHMGGLGDQTAVVAIVHEDQLLPTAGSGVGVGGVASPQQQQRRLRRLFQPHDFPVDLIVTPSFHHAIHARAARPDQIIWARISGRRLAVTPLLDALRDELLRQGRQLDAKDEDTDVETSRIQRNPNLARYHKNRGTVDELSGAELQAYNLVIFGRDPQEAAAAAAATMPNGVMVPANEWPQQQQQQQSMQSQPMIVRQQPLPLLHPQPHVQQHQHQTQHQSQPQQQQLLHQQQPLLPTIPLGRTEIGKDQMRWLIWQRFQQGTPYHSHHQHNSHGDGTTGIPAILNVDAAAHRLADTAEFRGAEHVMIFNQTNTEAIGLNAIHHGKQLYVPSPGGSPTAFTRVQPPPGLHTNGVLGPTYFMDNGVQKFHSRRKDIILGDGR